MSKQAFKRVRRAMKMEVNRLPMTNHEHGYGDLYWLCKDGGVLCHACVNKEIDLIDAATCRGDHDPQWQLVGYGCNWEDEGLDCDHCSKKIPSAYGEF